VTRRLTVAIVGMVAGALLLAGVGTLVLTQLGARQEARRDLEQQAVDVATSFQGARRPAVTQALRRALRLQGAEVVLFGASGNRVTALPAGVSDSDLDLAALRAGSVISGATLPTRVTAPPLRTLAIAVWIGSVAPSFVPQVATAFRKRSASCRSKS